ncbi:MAG TPA: pilus assembly protein [Rhizomicrobium sp.]|jgi:Flp pilus assembly protein TadG|nr:pilus assembly protein [Rhizomicrobium sp.]
MSIGETLREAWVRARAFLSNRDANVAMIFAISIIPVTIAAGTGLDLARAMIVRSALSEALDSSALAVASTTGLTQAQMQTEAQNYFNANYKTDSSYGTPSTISVVVSGQEVTVSTTVPMPTTLIGIAGIHTVNITESSTVVWGQNKLWVSLVLDNTGSMTQTDGTGTSKISALITATHQLLTMLQNASSTAGDVRAAIIPFSKTVNVGTSNVGASWIDWTDWKAAPPGGAPATTVGPGDSCPWSSGSDGFGCVKTPTNGSSSTSTIPSSGTYSGYICPGVEAANASTGAGGHYFNGCYTSVATGGTTTVSTGSSATCNGYTNCTCTGSNGSKKCKADNYTHTWTVNATSTWDGCVMDRTQSYDVNTTAPTGTSTYFPAENTQSCVPSVLGTLSYDWAALSAQVDAMTAGGSTNQTIGLDWGMFAQTPGVPLSAPALPANTNQYIIILSDGLNTQDRWSGDGSNQAAAVDARMALACTNAKAAGFTVYAIFVDLNGTQGNSTVLQDCASDSSKYFDLTTSGAIITTLNAIGQQITNLRVAQ